MTPIYIPLTYPVAITLGLGLAGWFIVLREVIRWVFKILRGNS